MKAVAACAQGRHPQHITAARATAGGAAEETPAAARIALLFFFLFALRLLSFLCACLKAERP